MTCSPYIFQLDSRLEEKQAWPQPRQAAFEEISSLHAWLEELDTKSLCIHKRLDDLLQSKRDRVHIVRKSQPPPSPTQLKLGLFRRARSLWRYSSFRAPPPKQDDRVDAQISQAEHHLHQLQYQRGVVATELDRIKSKVSDAACNKLPPEIWAIIFRYSMSADEPYVRPNIRSGPLLLCRVSRYWRDVAISTPHLWNSISISKGRRRSQPGAGPSLLALWLQRSGSLPLAVELSISSHMEATYDHDILNLILAHSHRWHRLRLNLTDTLMQSVLSAPLPNLETLELASNQALARLCLLEQEVPKLQNVALLTVPLDPSPLSLPWGQLTQFSSRRWADAQTHLDTLQRCHSLETCRIHLLHTSEASPVSDDSLLTMPHLRTLEVVAFTETAMHSILDRLVLPGLSELSLIISDESPSYGRSGWPKAVVHSLVGRSSCGTVRVKLDGIKVQHGDEDDCERIKRRLTVVKIRPRPQTPQ